ncbi:MAG: response regulator [Acidobacteria bacterium]|nr:response regulator [Acidobacteriota bacterium]
MPSTILIADDEPAFREYMATLLRTQGFRVVAAANGVEALKEFASVQPA